MNLENRVGLLGGMFVALDVPGVVRVLLGGGVVGDGDGDGDCSGEPVCSFSRCCCRRSRYFRISISRTSISRTQLLDGLPVPGMAKYIIYKCVRKLDVRRPDGFATFATV